MHFMSQVRYPMSHTPLSHSIINSGLCFSIYFLGNINITTAAVLWTYSWYISHDDVIKWKHFPRNWPFVREIHRSPVNFPHKGQWRGALMFSLNYAWINDWVNNREAGDLRRQHGHYDVIVMLNDECRYTDHPFYLVCEVLKSMLVYE